ncbi:hypothetical protein K491DRAFT_178244 [Lophiostoma macrostomum CBS 122681]|uniref:F-box domain-containing protein n=1 Tax=Lophiostoma macrostomum CBS 122681 TaxID=1314788 RepID=A0A6A6TUY5_9PLEO|nr:hypothetical protein K491DRAFT_178244 [Lophiostoma macrostomum CBS 122681]
MTRAKKGPAAGAIALGCKRGTKRGATGGLHLASKKQKKEEQIFRFLDLPGELQNHIYELAAAETRRKWPILHNKLPDRSQRRTRSKPQSPPPKRTFPFLGFSQTCRKIRSEFRPWWMNGHRLPLSELDDYISVFFRGQLKKGRDRQDPYFNPAGMLRVWVRDSELKDIDIMRLVKLKVRLPNYTIIFDHGSDVPGPLIYGLNQLVNNTNAQWLRWLRGNIITQVRIRQNNNSASHKFYVVVKEKWAKDWMKPALNQAVADGFLDTIGLEDLVYWNVRFGVCYS